MAAKRTSGQSRPSVIVRSHGKSRKKSSEIVEGKLVLPPKSSKKTLKQSATVVSSANDPVQIRTKTSTNKKKSKSNEKTAKAIGTLEEYDTKDEVTAKDQSDKKQKTICLTAEEKLPSKKEQRTQDGSLETAKQKKKKVKTEEFLDSQGDDDTLRCVKSICN